MEEPRLNRPNGGTVRGFGVRLVDPTTNGVVFDYNPQSAIDDGSLVPGGADDGFHANWANVYENAAGQEVLYVSLCHTQEIVAIDVPSGDWRWSFGRNQDFTLVDTNGNALPNGFPSCQHGLAVKDNRLLVYDNGHSSGVSRATEYELDEATMTATRLWTWTEPGWSQRSLGGVAYGTGNRVLISMGHIESAAPQQTRGSVSKFVEIDSATGDKLWEAHYGLSTGMAFRLEAIAPCDIFANAKYCPVVEKRLSTLADVLSGNITAPN